ncbi:uncharacterized protein LOC120533395 isoform X1 [Polypterus senegalus]|uniref:uncharacterized protein LOC120533395 isoform X1 n=1 Tax=Polypterus senegalus TaxID=55291 RepID=UPI001962BE73|nr:uncharacterized protein LOC120533395 isoform X1 [Polypterus senegalus]XP_039616183.1 uncharacterized protein LOC120533395 isoform X1 [Polypterus senegalus]
MDAGIEDGSLGRLVNDDPNPNCRMKKIEVNHRPHLCIFALRDIFPKEEITYDYGGCNLPWRQTIKKGRGTSSTNISENSVIDLSTLEKPAVHNQSSNSASKGEPAQPGTSSTNISENSVIDLSTLEKPAVHNQSSNSASKGEPAQPDYETDSADVETDSSDDYIPETEMDSVSENDSISTAYLSTEDKMAPLGEVTSEKEMGKSFNPVHVSNMEGNPAPNTSKNASSNSVNNNQSSCSAQTSINIERKDASLPNTHNFIGPSVTNADSSGKKNYCYVCGKSQFKLARHFKFHEKQEADIAKALSLPKKSKQRKRLLERLRNKGNFLHNSEVLRSGNGELKLKRKPKTKKGHTEYQHCLYCKGLFVRKELWRHVRICKFNPKSAEERNQKGRKRILSLALTSYSVATPQVCEGVWAIISQMNQDSISSIVRNDVCLLHLAQSFYNKHGHDQSKHEYIRQKLREIGRFLEVIRNQSLIYNLEETVKPINFEAVIKAVKVVAGFDEDKQIYKTPSLALKLGHSLQKVCDIVHCRALISEDTELQQATESFKKLYNTKWNEYISHRALFSLNVVKYNKPSTLPFTEDVQKLHRYLDNYSQLWTRELKFNATPRAYTNVANISTNNNIQS